MLAVTHLAVSLLLIQVLTLDRNDSFIALLFGVAIDADHLLGLKDYAQANGYLSILDFDSLMHADGQWKSLLHNPMAAVYVGSISVASRFALPLLFWGVHVFMDQVEDTFLGVCSIPELVFLGLTSAVLVAFILRRDVCHSLLARVAWHMHGGLSLVGRGRQP